MYRKPLLTVGDLEELKGKLVRLEVLNGWGHCVAAIITGNDNNRLFYIRETDHPDQLDVLYSTYLVVATDLKAVIPAGEPQGTLVRWDNRHTWREGVDWSAN